jgi:ThiF family
MIAMPTFEVIVPFSAWRQALMPILTQRDLVATGMLLRDPSREPPGLLLGHLAATLRTGADFPPLADWIAIASPPGEPPERPDAWIRRLQPRLAQLLVILLVGLGRDRQQWRGWNTERGVIHPLAGLRIIGPGMVHATASRSVDPLDAGDDARWSRLRGAVGESVFAKLRETEIALIGCSRSGTLAAGMFAALAVRGLSLIDPDAIEPHNLDGMILATEADMGEKKGMALGRRLIAYRPDLMVKAVPHPLNSPSGKAALQGADLIVTCVDQDGARLQAAHWAAAHLAPHLDIGTGVTRSARGDHQLAADVRLLLPRAGCIRCVGGLGDPDQAEYELYAPYGALLRRPPEAWNSGRLGSLVTLNRLAVSFGVQSWLDLLAGSLASSIWHRLCWREGVGLEVNSALVEGGEGCALCTTV